MDFNNAQKTATPPVQKPAVTPAPKTATPPVAKKKSLTVEEKKKELDARKKTIQDQLDKKRKALNKIKRDEENLLNPKQSRKDRTRALCLLAGMLLEDLKKTKDVAKMDSYKSRLTTPSDKEKFAFLIKEVAGTK